MTTRIGTDVRQLLTKHFGFEQFRDGQEQVIAHLMNGHSAAAVFPTGGGKSLCYQLPAIALQGVTLVVSPLIALMKDQIDALRKREIPAARLDSTLNGDEYREVVQSLRNSRLKLLYVAPERFNNERFRQLLDQIDVAVFAIDEAHCISEWGHNFRPDYLKLARYARHCDARCVLALTATAPPKVLHDICREFQIREEHAVRTDFYRENLRLLSNAETEESRNKQLVAKLQQRPNAATIVYVTLQKTAERVADMLQSHGFQTRHYHAGLKPEERTATQEWFVDQDDGIVVATIAFGMGIDKSNIRYVYHYNISKSVENYAQEIGRAGRDGKPAICETFLVADDLLTLRNFVYGDTPDSSSVHSFVADVFSRGPDFGLSVYEMSVKHDIRELVIRTLLTYLELDGFLRSGTPYYAKYKFKPLLGSKEILQRFDGDRRQFLATIFRQAKPGRVWFSLDLEACANSTKSDRQRVIRALDYLAEQDLIELKTAGVHHRFTVLKSPHIGTLSESLTERTIMRQQRELERLQNLLQLFSHNGCQVSALGEYFGEPLPQPCGHCTWCETEQPTKLGSSSANASIQPLLWAKLEQLRGKHPDVLTSPQSLTRFACGVTSPLIVKAKLSRHELFGCLADVPFATILSAASVAAK